MEIINAGLEPCVVTLRGRFDAKECYDFGRHISQVLQGGCTGLVIDMSGVDFIDSSALADIVSLAKWSAAHDRTFRIQEPSHPVRKVLEMTGIERALTIITTSASGS